MENQSSASEGNRNHGNRQPLERERWLWKVEHPATRTPRIGKRLVEGLDTDRRQQLDDGAGAYSALFELGEWREQPHRHGERDVDGGEQHQFQAAGQLA